MPSFVANQAARESFLREMEPYLRHMVSKFSCPGWEFDDLLQEARIGALAGYDTYNEGKGAARTSWACTCARNALRHVLRDKRGLIREPVYRQDQRSAGKRDDPYPRVITTDKISALEALAERTSPLPDIADEATDRALVETLLRGLTTRQRERLWRHYGQQETYQEIGERCGITAEGIFLNVRRSMRRVQRLAFAMR